LEKVKLTFLTDTNSLGTNAEQEEKEVRLIGRVRSWYNCKLQGTISESPDIDLYFTEDLEIPTEDQYSAEYITNKVFGILHQFPTDHKFLYDQESCTT
jgi:hypothetical protein